MARRRKATVAVPGTPEASKSYRAARNRFADISRALESAMTTGRNVLLRGERGVGKTHMVMALAKQHGLRMKYFSASTLDPFADLVGIPVPREKHIEYLRSLDLNEAQFLFFDELNRAHKRTVNAVLEIIQFRSLNGEPLPHLQLVWAAINPWDRAEYDTEKLDEAILDRFHFHIDIPYELSPSYLEDTYGPSIAPEVFSWWNGLDAALRAKVSPRRMDYLVKAIVDGLAAGNIIPFDTPSLPIAALKQKVALAQGSVTLTEMLQDQDTFIKVLDAQDTGDQKFTDSVRLLCALPEDALAMAIEIAVHMPSEYLAKIMFREGKYNRNLRAHILNKHNVNTLMKMDEIITKLLSTEGA